MSLSASSFRDPDSGVKSDGLNIYRPITQAYAPVYNKLMASGLYNELVCQNLLIPHDEMMFSGKLSIYPEIVETISYPYEWCFTQLKKAALVTLKICELAIEHGLILKDASAFNIQHHNGHWLLIDTGSFALYKEGEPWCAYEQFLRHFLSPLLLAKYVSPALLKLSMNCIDGIEAKEVSRMLPDFTYLVPSCFMHIHSHRLVGKPSDKNYSISKFRLLALLDNLASVINGLHIKHSSEWVEYEQHSDYSINKWEEILKLALNLDAKSILDVGANIGHYSFMFSGSRSVIALDREHDCVDIMAENSNAMLPLVVDITNTTPAIGWANQERQSFIERVKPDAILALAVIHHICAGNNVPLGMVSDLFSQIAKKWAVVEFVSPEDDKFREITKGRIYPPYSKEIFESEFCRNFTLESKEVLKPCRELYLLRKK